MALTGGVWSLSAQAKESGVTISPFGTATIDSIPSPIAEAIASIEQSLEFGTDDGEANVLCAAAFVLAGAGTITFDLFAGTDLPNLFSGTAAMVKLKGLFIGIVEGGDADGVTIGDAAANPALMWFGAVDQTWTIYPEGAPMTGGDPVGRTIDNTDKNLLITNNGAAEVTIVIALAGSSA